MADVVTEVNVYRVALLPRDYREGYLWEIKVEYRGRDLWAVCRNGECLGSDGTWEWDSRSMVEDDDWRAAHRFPLGEALALAREWAPKVSVFSHRDKKQMTAGDVLEKYPDEILT